MDKVELYLDNVVKHVWIVAPLGQTITAYRPAARPAMFVNSQALLVGPDMPGFALEVAEVFRP